VKLLDDLTEIKGYSILKYETLYALCGELSLEGDIGLSQDTKRNE